MTKKLYAKFSGSIQGIGFRYTAKDLADNLGIRGWVKNLTDGRVEVLAEGEEKILKNFLEKINQNFSVNIHDSEVQWSKPNGEFKNFSIEF